MIDTKELRTALVRHGTSVLNEDEVLELLDRLESAEKSDAESIAMYRKARDERDALRAELETERMRLAACGVVALANTPDSAKQAREMRPEYWSAARAVMWLA